MIFVDRYISVGEAHTMPSAGVEKPKIKSAASGTAEERCRPLKPEFPGLQRPLCETLRDWEGRESEGVKRIPHAAENRQVI